MCEVPIHCRCVSARSFESSTRNGTLKSTSRLKEHGRKHIEYRHGWRFVCATPRTPFCDQHWGVSRGRPHSPFLLYGRRCSSERGRHQATRAVTTISVWQSDISIEMSHFSLRRRIRRVGASRCPYNHDMRLMLSSKRWMALKTI